MDQETTKENKMQTQRLPLKPYKKNHREKEPNNYADIEVKFYQKERIGLKQTLEVTVEIESKYYSIDRNSYIEVYSNTFYDADRRVITKESTRKCSIDIQLVPRGGATTDQLPEYVEVYIYNPDKKLYRTEVYGFYLDLKNMCKQFEEWSPNPSSQANILVVGPPGSGKTTLIQRIESIVGSDSQKLSFKEYQTSDAPNQDFSQMLIDFHGIIFVVSQKFRVFANLKPEKINNIKSNYIIPTMRAGIKSVFCVTEMDIIGEPEDTFDKVQEDMGSYFGFSSLDLFLTGNVKEEFSTTLPLFSMIEKCLGNCLIQINKLKSKAQTESMKPKTLPSQTQIEGQVNLREDFHDSRRKNEIYQESYSSVQKAEYLNKKSVDLVPQVQLSTPAKDLVKYIKIISIDEEKEEEEEIEDILEVFDLNSHYASDLRKSIREDEDLNQKLNDSFFFLIEDGFIEAQEEEKEVLLKEVVMKRDNVPVAFIHIKKKPFIPVAHFDSKEELTRIEITNWTTNSLKISEFRSMVETNLQGLTDFDFDFDFVHSETERILDRKKESKVTLFAILSSEDECFVKLNRNSERGQEDVDSKLKK